MSGIEVPGLQSLLDHPVGGYPWPRVVMAMGNFDGVHLGHQEILRETVAVAKALGGTSVCLTFSPHPSRVLHPERQTKMLQTPAQKCETILGLGIDVLVVQPFDLAFSKEEYDYFFEKDLRRILNPKAIRVGSRFAFGHERRGNPENLGKLCAPLGIDFKALPERRENGEVISSSKIRGLLAQGQVSEAGRLLGRPYTLRGRVTEGDHRGRAIGFPTANLVVENDALLPLGVYACKVRKISETVWRDGVANWGVRPTFTTSETSALLEVHLFDHDESLYGEVLDVACESFLRPEKRFASVDDLRQQIVKDCESARVFLGAVKIK